MKITDIPLPFLLEFEKQLSDMISLVQAVPTLDPRRAWEFDKERNLYRSKPEASVRNKKTPTVITKAQATQHHPAQTELVNQDNPVGEYQTIYESGKLTMFAKRETLRRLEDLKTQVRSARALANAEQVDQRTMNVSGLLKWVFEPMRPA